MKRTFQCCMGRKLHEHDCLAAEFFGLAKEPAPPLLTPEAMYTEAKALGCTDDEARLVAEVEK